MNKIAALLFLAFPVLLPAATSVVPHPEAANQARYAEVRSRIAGLFDHRDAAPVEIEYADNPFLIGVVRPPSAEGPVEAPPSEDAETRLREIVSGFRVNGLVQRSGDSFIIINQEARKVGDLIPVAYKGAPYFVRVTEIANGVVTFSLEGVTIRQRF